MCLIIWLFWVLACQGLKYGPIICSPCFAQEETTTVRLFLGSSTVLVQMIDQAFNNLVPLTTKVKWYLKTKHSCVLSLYMVQRFRPWMHQSQNEDWQVVQPLIFDKHKTKQAHCQGKMCRSWLGMVGKKTTRQKGGTKRIWHWTKKNKKLASWGSTGAMKIRLLIRDWEQERQLCRILTEQKAEISNRSLKNPD